MRKGFMGIISLALIFCLVLAGCGSAQAKDSVSEEAAESSAETAEEQDTPEVASEQDTPEVTQQARHPRGHTARGRSAGGRRRRDYDRK